MALIWKKCVGDTSYQVTKAGNSIRLYRNGVLHSQWNPKNRLRGQLWELFLLSSFSDQHKIERALVLGVGGGAVINLIHYFFPAARVDAIDVDATHLYVAKKFFKVDGKRCHLIHADASRWLRGNNRGKYDLIIDDVFSEVNQVPHRSVSAEGQWIRKLLRQLSSEGVLVMNFADQQEWSLCRKNESVKQLLDSYEVGVVMHNACQNRIVHISRRALSTSVIKKELGSGIMKPLLRSWIKGEFMYRLQR